jgi:hypothetical protein
MALPSTACEPKCVKRAIPLGLSLIMLLVLVPLQPLAETAKKPSKSTELVIWKYETLLMQGALLTPQGWNTASALFQHHFVYPEDGPITIVWTPRVIGEDWVKGNRAQVESKWVELYGSVDAKLRYHPQDFDCPAITIYDLTLTDTRNEGDPNRTATQVQGAMEWKVAGPNKRAATIEQAISYLNQQRERTHDLVIKQNAIRSITSLQDLLKKLKRGRGSSAC